MNDKPTFSSAFLCRTVGAGYERIRGCLKGAYVSTTHQSSAGVITERTSNIDATSSLGRTFSTTGSEDSVRLPATFAGLYELESVMVHCLKIIGRVGRNFFGQYRWFNGFSSCLIFMLLCRCEGHSPDDSKNLREMTSSSISMTKEAQVQPSLAANARRESKMRELTFAWKPKNGPASVYEMTDSRDQHQILLSPNLGNLRQKPVILLHGQPRRGARPRDYEFPRVVIKCVQQLLDENAIEPLVLIIPKFRFEGENWPQFNLDEFLVKANEMLNAEGIVLEHPYVLGHSGAAGCGGAGLNSVVKVAPSAVGFFDTCIGPGFVAAATELLRKKIPTLIVHSVETAGYRPRQRTEYLSSFDFGKVYRKIGLTPSACPGKLPEVPLRTLEARCSSDATNNTRALVVDTGEGEAAHNAVVPVALQYFLREYLHRSP